MPAELRSIAMVDDHVIFVDAMEGLLSLMGYRVVLRAHSAESFMHQMTHAPAPQLALVDLQLPGENGFAVLRWLRSHRPEVPGVVLSFSTEPELVRAALEAGARSFLSKMEDRHVMKRVLEEVLASGHSTTEVMLRDVERSTVRARALALGVPQRELDFLQQIMNPADLTYDQVASNMKVSRSAVDGYARWFEKRFGLHSRSAIGLWAIAHGLVQGQSADAQLAFTAWRMNRELTPPPPARVADSTSAPRAVCLSA